jgi:ubiquinone biosynthesis protein
MPALEDQVTVGKKIAKLAAREGVARVKEVVPGGQPPDEATMAKKFARDLEDMGPAFIKLGQLLCGQIDGLPASYREELSVLHENVTPVLWADISQVIYEEFGSTPEDLFLEISPVPLATASLAQVHRAVTKTGEVVAVKVQRPGVEEALATDFAALKRLAKTLHGRFGVNQELELPKVVDNLRQRLLQETDYRVELSNLDNFHQYFKEFSLLYVPTPHPELSGQRVLTMDFVEGQQIEESTLADVPRIHRLQLADQIFKAYLEQVLVEGTYHADPHPGNVRLTDDYRVVFLDLGMVGHVTTDMRHLMSVMLLQLAEGQSGKVADVALQMVVAGENADPKGFRQAVIDLTDTYKGLPMEQMQAGSVILEICQKATTFGLSVPPQLSLLAKTLVHLDALGKAIAPYFDPNRSLRKHVTQILETITLDWFSLPTLAKGSHEVKKLVTEGPSLVYDILTSLSHKDFSVRVDALDEVRWFDHLQKIANRVTVGLLLAAMIVGGALLAHVDNASYQIMGYPALAFVCFLVAFVGGALLAAKIVWSDMLGLSD